MIRILLACAAALPGGPPPGSWPAFQGAGATPVDAASCRSNGLPKKMLPGKPTCLDRANPPRSSGGDKVLFMCIKGTMRIIPTYWPCRSRMGGYFGSRSFPHRKTVKQLLPISCNANPRGGCRSRLCLF